MVGKPQTKKGKPRGRPWPKGVSGHPAGNRHLGDVLRSRFAHEMLKVVPAKVGGVMIEAPRYELFITQMIEAGIKGNTPARKLLLEFMNANDAAEVAAEQQAKQATERGTGAFDWGAAKEKTMKQLAATIKAARRAERG